MNQVDISISIANVIILNQGKRRSKKKQSILVYLG